MIDLRPVPGTVAGLSLIAVGKFGLASLLAVSQAGCCGWNPFATQLEPDVRATYLAAVRDPEEFDERIPSLEVPEGAPACFRELSAEAFALENEKLLSCSALLERSPAWNECHEEAEQIHNHGVVLGNVADALDGRRAFLDSQGGALLVFFKTQLGPSFYEDLVDRFSTLTPDMRCELGCV